MDARDFVRKLVTPDKIIPFNHVIMNLPASAVEFLGKHIHSYIYLITPFQMCLLVYIHI